MDNAPACCGETPPVAESCNCTDDDCNGATDEGFFADCFTLGDGCDVSTGTCKGICWLGKWDGVDVDPGPDCTAGWGACLGQVGPRPEVCNCVDDDCDAMTDDDALCATGGRCENCACPDPCDVAAEFPCPAGYLCECHATEDCACGADAATNPACSDNWFCQAAPLTRTRSGRARTAGPR